MLPHFATPIRPLTLTIMAIAVTVWTASQAQAQVNVLDKPYRTAAVTAPPFIDLPIKRFVAPGLATATSTAPASELVATPVNAPEITIHWDVLPEDQTLSRALGRWTRVVGLQFFWEAPKDLVAVKATYSGSFNEALQTVMLDSPTSGYPLHACRHDNAIRVLHTSQPCKH